MLVRNDDVSHYLVFVIGFCLCCNYEQVNLRVRRLVVISVVSRSQMFVRYCAIAPIPFSAAVRPFNACVCSHIHVSRPLAPFGNSSRTKTLAPLRTCTCQMQQWPPTSNSSPTVEEFAADASNLPPFKISRVHNTDLLKTWRGKSLFVVQGCSTTFVTVVGVHNHFQDVFKEASLRDELALKPLLLPNALSRSLVPDRIRIFSFQV